MFDLSKQILKDVCTVKNGEDACIAGIAMVIGMSVGLLVLVYALWNSADHTLASYGGILKDFGTYQAEVITSGCIGKGAKAIMGAERDNDYIPPVQNNVALPPEGA